MDLPALHRQVLIFEATWRPSKARGNTRADAVRARFDLSMLEYKKIVAEACDHPDALRVAPAVVRRQQAITRRLVNRPRASRPGTVENEAVRSA